MSDSRLFDVSIYIWMSKHIPFRKIKNLHILNIGVSVNRHWNYSLTKLQPVKLLFLGWYFLIFWRQKQFPAIYITIRLAHDPYTDQYITKDSQKSKGLKKVCFGSIKMCLS